MYKKKKVAMLKHRRRQEKLKEKRKARALTLPTKILKKAAQGPKKSRGVGVDSAKEQ